MRFSHLLIATTFFGQFAFGQYCTTGGPSQTIDSNVESVVLNGSTGSINYTGCPGVTGVEEQLGMVTYLSVGANYTATIQFGTCGGNYSGIGQAWIDFNQNGSFEATESIGTWQGTPPTAVTNMSFNVPGAAINGLTRMRVMQAEGTSFPLNPCQSFAWGSVVDFGIYIQNGIDCSGYTGDAISNPRVVSSLPFAENHSTSFCYTNQNAVYNSPDVYYFIPIPTGTTTLTASLCGSQFDTFLTALDNNGDILSINDDYSSCGAQSQLTIDVSNKTAIYLIVEGWGNNSGNYALNIQGSSLSVDENGINTPILYPNPTSSEFSINNYEGQIQILDLNGKLILDHMCQGNQPISTVDFEKGVYLVKWMDLATPSTTKLIIQ